MTAFEPGDIWKRQANGAGGGIPVVALGIKGKKGIKMRRGQKTFKMLKLLRVDDFRGRHTPPVIKPTNCTALSVNSPERQQALRKEGVRSAQWLNKYTAGVESTGEKEGYSWTGISTSIFCAVFVKKWQRTVE